MKKFLTIIIFLLLGIVAFSQTTIPPASTWTPARNIINANFVNTYDSIAANRLRVNILYDSVLTHRTAINLRLLKSDTASMLANYTRNGELNSALAAKVNVSDTAAMLSPYALTSELGDAGTSIGDVRDEIADSLNVLRPLYVAIADTAAMLDPYAKLTDLSEGGIGIGAVQEEIADSLNVLRAAVTVGDGTKAPYFDGSQDGGQILYFYGNNGFYTAIQGGAPVANRSYRLPIAALPSAGTTSLLNIDEYGNMGFVSSTTYAPTANPTFTGVQKVSTTDTLATKAYARSVGGGDVSALETRVDSIVDVLADTANIEAILLVDLDTDTLATKAYARSVGGGGTAGITLNYGTLTLDGDEGTADDITFYTNGDGSYNLPAGGGNLTIMSEVQGWINDSLDVFRPLYLEVADTASMLSHYAKLSDLSEGSVSLAAVQEEIADSLNAIRSASIPGLALADSTGYAPGNYVTHTQLDAVGSGADSSLYVTVTRLTDSLNVMRNLINDLIAVVEGLGVDVTAPSIDSVEIGNFADDTLVIYFNERLNTDSIPASSVFYLTEDANEMGIASISLPNDTMMYVVLDSTALYGSTYLLDYTRAHPYLQDSTGNAIANFSNRSVINNMPEPAATGLLEGLIAYWDMQESSGNIVDEVASLTGVPASTAPNYSQAGRIGNAINFNYTPSYGSGTRFDVGDDILQTNQVSISVWIYPTESADAFAIISNNASGYGYRLFCGGGGGGVAADVSDGSGHTAAPDAGTLTINTWYHVVLVVDGTNVTTYINGAQSDQEAFAYNIGYGSGSSVTIGANYDNGNSFGGRIDELGVWNRALTTDEIAALYNSGSGLSYSSFGN